ncbi:SLC13 family permease [Sporomusa aerivorans]|uniref:SLC13 family permease n=1 Tax=Sporomusa aerivorans TaxID=204936 RepID=UPI00352B0D20
MTEAKRINWLKIIGGIIGIIIGIAIANIPAPEGISKQAMWGIGIFSWAVVWWIADVLSDFGTGLLMCCAWAVFKVVPFSVAFASFSTSTIWIIVGALGFGVAATRSGLLNRVALMTMSKFPLTFGGQVLALLSAGLVLTPFIPSGTAKAAVLAPFARSICENMGYESKSPGATGLFNALFVTTGLAYPIFLSGNFLCYAILGLLPKDVQAQMTWGTWFINALPWGLTMLVLSYFAIVTLYKPKESNSMNSGFIKDRLDKLGPMTKHEIITGVVLIIALILWMTERMHGIESAIVACVALIVLMAFGVFDRNAFRANIAWDAVVFIGALINVSGVFKTLKIDAWIGKVLAPYLSPLVSGNIFLFIILLCLIIYVVRVVLVSQLATAAILILVLTPFSIQAGINPWVTAFVIFVAVNVWYTFYQNASFLVAYYATGGDMVEHKHTVKMCVVYMAVSLLGLLISVPVWKMTGLIR